MEIPKVIKDLEALYRRVNKKVKKYGPLSDEEINNIIQQSRRRGARTVVAIMKIVLDTNVLISALIKEGKPRDLFLEILLNHELVISREILEERALRFSRV